MTQFSDYVDASASAGASVAYTGNSYGVTGGNQTDFFSIIRRASAYGGGTASLTGNAVSIVAGDGDDGQYYYYDPTWNYGYYVQDSTTSVEAQAYGEWSRAEASANTIEYSGGLGSDFHRSEIRAIGGYAGASRASSNIALSTGGEGNDTLVVSSNAYGLGAGGTATTESTTAVLRGDGGLDSLSASADAQANWGGGAELNAHDFLLDGGGDGDFLTVTVSATGGYHFGPAEASGVASASANTAALVGGEGDDQVWAATHANGHGAGSRAISADNVFSLTGDEGADSVNRSTSASSSGGGIATVFGDRASLSGGADGDSLTLMANADASGMGSISTVDRTEALLDGGSGSDWMNMPVYLRALDDGYAEYSSNIATLLGGADGDQMSLSFWLAVGDYWNASAGSVSAFHNTLILEGEDGDDDLSVSLSGSSAGDGALGFTGNHVSQLGGEGNDRLSLNVHATAGSSYAGGDTGSVSIDGNAFAAIGGGGDDSISLYLNASGLQAAEASIDGNFLVADGGDGNDYIVFGMSLYAPSGIATASGNVIQLRGGDGDDQVHARLDGSGNTLSVDGGAGNDLLSFASWTGSLANQVLIDGGDGIDQIQFNFFNEMSPVTVDFSTGYEMPFDGVRLVNIESLRFDSGWGDDNLSGGSLSDWIFGNGGDDRIASGGGSDYLYGGEGNDTLVLSRNRIDYSFVAQSDGFLVVDNLTGAVTEAHGFEAYEFADGTFAPGDLQNRPPAVTGPVATWVSENAPLVTIDLLQGAWDGDGDALTIADFGFMTGSSDRLAYTVQGGQLSFDPNQFNGLASGQQITLIAFYRIEDGRGGSVLQSAQILIEGANDQPIVGAVDFGAVSEDSGMFSGYLAANASDPEIDMLRVGDLSAVTVSGRTVAVSQSGSFLELDAGQFNDLALGESETVVVSFSVSDGMASPVFSTATLVVTGANDQPTASPIRLTPISEDAGARIDLLQNASDVDGDALSIVPGSVRVTSANFQRNVAFTMDGNTVVIDPAQFNNLASWQALGLTITYAIADAHGATTVSEATVLIQGMNDQPVITPSVLPSVSEDAGAYLTVRLFEGGDPDNDQIYVDKLTAVTDTGRVIAVNPMGRLVYFDTGQFNSLGAGESETITFSYTVSDGIGAAIPATTRLVVTGTNDQPVVTPIFAGVVAEDQAATIDLLQGASDPDGDALSIADGSVRVSSSNGARTVAFTLQGSSIVVDPAQFNGLKQSQSETLTVTYSVADGQGGARANTATIVVSGTNDAPTITAPLHLGTVSEDDAVLFVNGLTGASDPDGDPLYVGVPHSATTSSGLFVFIQSQNNMLVINPGLFNRLDSGESETLTITYSVSDPNGGYVTNTATLVVTGADDQPTFLPSQTGNISEDAPLAINLLGGARDVDGEVLSLIPGSVQVTSSNGSRAVAFTLSGNILSIPPAQFNGLDTGESELLTISYAITDGDGAPVANSLSVRVHGSDDQPVMTPVHDSFSEDATMAIDLAQGGFDVDGDALVLVEGSLQLVPSNGERTVAFTLSNGSIMIDPGQFNDLAAGESETVMITYALHDGDGAPIETWAAVTIQGGDDHRELNGTNQADLLVGDGDAFGTQDTIRGGNGNDTIGGQAGADTLYGDNGDDRLEGGSGKDALHGGNGADRLDGGAGDDLIVGGTGEDILVGGLGSDLFVFGRASGIDTVLDFDAASDRIQLDDGVTVTNQIVFDADGDGALDLVLQLSSGTVTLIGVSEPLVTDAFVA